MADLTNIDVAKYVVEHIDEAIEKEWIKVYYQPVIRAITEELCSTESLARWVDPNVGFLPPDSFIGVLETSNLIHKLDCYVVRKVCKDMHDLMAQNLPVVPVSVNFSRLDFIMCDMLKVVEDAVEENDIPRDYIHVEITESMIVSDEELMSRVINQFRNAGYEVWMDDFGSGYSSLTLLKDYQFDLLKMDMRFLSTFNDKSKSILRSTITMAKDIGMKTLAEGVETKEHFQFLRDNGCGKIQGYYFGKPEPIQDMMKHMEEKGIPFEKRQWKHFYEIASFHVRNTDVPLHIVFDDGNNFKSLFMNEAYRSQIGISVFDDYSEVDKRLHRHGSPLLKRYREMANTMEKSGNLETFYYTEGGIYLKMQGMVIAKNNGCYIISAEIHNITATIRDDESRKLDTRLRELNVLYETVLVINIKNNNSEPLLGRYEYVAEEYRDPYKSLSVDIEHFTQEYVFPSQRERYREFMDMENLQSRIEATESGHIEEAFRIKQENGNYEWREVTIMQLPHANREEYLYCIKTLSKGLNLDESFADGLQMDKAKKERVYANIWENLMLDCSVKFFWKDNDRRFLGVSQSFLDFYGIKRREDILGKNDEEMHWHVDDGPYQGDELDVLHHGIRVSNAPGQCIVNGVVHNIVCNKMPIYDPDGKIIGLVGYFIDGEEELARLNKLDGPGNDDPVTGLMNARSFLDAMIGYAVQFSEKKRNYGLILLTNEKYERIKDTYGDEISDKLLHMIGQKIIDVTGQTCAVARTKESLFAVMTYIQTAENLENLAQRIKSSIETIREVDGNDVTVRIKTAAKLRTEEKVTDELLYQLVIEELGQI